MSALELANEIRTKRSNLKRDVRAGAVSVADVIEEAPEYLLGRPEKASGVAVWEILTWQPRYGAARARRTLIKLGFPAGVMLRALSEKRRQQLAELLR